MGRYKTGCITLVGIWLMAMPMVLAAETPVSPQLKFADCPAPVQKTLRSEAKNTPIETVETTDDDGEISYTAKVLIKNRNYSITVADDGTLIEKSLDNESEQKLLLSKCPKVVQETFREETGSIIIKTVNRETNNGMIYYSADVKIGPNHYWISVAENGVLLDKVLNNTDEDETPPVKILASSTLPQKHSISPSIA